MSKIYHGFYDHKVGGCVITVERNESNKLLVHRKRHSPTGFQWGYGGSGPADTALSILWDYLGREPGEGLYQAFKFEVVAKFPYGGEWTLSGDEVKAWLGERNVVIDESPTRKHKPTA